MCADEVTNTELDVEIPERWRAKMLLGLYDTAPIPQRVLSASGEVAESGDKVHVTIEPSVSTNDVGSSGSVTNQSLTPTEAIITVDKWKESTIEVVKKANRQAMGMLVEGFPRAAGRALGQQVNKDILALESGVTQTAGNGLGDIGEQEILKAIQTLLANDLDVLLNPGEYTFVFIPDQYKPLKTANVYNDASLMGAGSTGGGTKTSLGNVQGIPTYFSSQIAESSSIDRNLLFKMEAFGWAVQSNFEFEELPSPRKSRIFSTDVLYGVKTIRANHAVAVQSLPG